VLQTKGTLVLDLDNVYDLDFYGARTYYEVCHKTNAKFVKKSKIGHLSKFVFLSFLSPHIFLSFHDFNYSFYSDTRLKQTFHRTPYPGQAMNLWVFLKTPIFW